MYFKVALIFIISIFISGCSFTKMLRPKAPATKENNTTKAMEDNSTIIPLTDNKIVETKDKYNLKPEPFSLESNEDDPELLGPQSTIKDRLTKEDDTLEEDSSTSNQQTANNNDKTKEL